MRNPIISIPLPNYIDDNRQTCLAKADVAWERATTLQTCMPLLVGEAATVCNHYREVVRESKAKFADTNFEQT